MNKRILISLSVIGAVAAIAIGGTVAYFSDVETSRGNTLTAGTIDISVDDQNPWQRTYSEVLSDMKPSQWRDYYYQIHNTGNNPADIWKHLKVIKTETGIQSEPECEEEKGTWDGEKCVWASEADRLANENNAIDEVITYDLFVQTAWDQCGNGTGTSSPGPAPGNPGQCGQPGAPADCCNWNQTSHVHDLGKLITTKADLIIDYMPGFAPGCTSTLTVEVSETGMDNTWKKIKEKPVVSEALPGGGWKTYRQKLYGIEKDFRYVKMTIPNCYNDYSAVYLLEPIIAPEDGVEVSDVHSCWIYLGRLKPSERIFVEQSYHLQPTVTNWAQGDKMGFDIELLAQQIGAPKPTPICD